MFLAQLLIDWCDGFAWIRMGRAAGAEWYGLSFSLYRCVKSDQCISLRVHASIHASMHDSQGPHHLAVKSTTASCLLPTRHGRRMRSGRAGSRDPSDSLLLPLTMVSKVFSSLISTTDEAAPAWMPLGYFHEGEGSHQCDIQVCTICHAPLRHCNTRGGDKPCDF